MPTEFEERFKGVRFYMDGQEIKGDIPEAELPPNAEEGTQQQEIKIACRIERKYKEYSYRPWLRKRVLEFVGAFNTMACKRYRLIRKCKARRIMRRYREMVKRCR